MHCPECGNQLPGDAQFCPNCGALVGRQVTSPYVPGTQGAQALHGDDPHASTDAMAYEQSPQQERPQRRKTAVIATIAIGIVLVAVGIGATVLFSHMHERILNTPHPVTFWVEIDGFDENSSRIPVRITGTNVAGEQVDKTLYLAHSGVDTELLAGTYEARVLGSPISSQGFIYEVPTDVISFTLGDDLEAGEPYELPSDVAFHFTVINPAMVTDKEVEDALKWARKDEQSGVDVRQLEKAIESLRDQANQAD